MRILIVDDEPAVLRAELRMLQSAGHDCRGGATLDEARALVAAEPFDVAILDVHVGADNGLDLARELQRDHPDIPIIMVTGAQDFTTVSQARIIGAIDYLVKPMTGDAIKQAVDRAGAIRLRRGKAAAAGVAAPSAPPGAPAPLSRHA